MAENLTLIDFIRELLGLEGESKAIELRDFYQQNPQAALNEYGLGHLSPEDVQDAITLVQDNDTVSFDRNYDTGFKWDGGHDKGGWDGGKDHGGDWGHKGGHADPAVREHVTNNHVTNNIDDRDTTVDNSINQNIDTHGGDVDQSFYNNSVTASGDGAVAAGDDIKGSTVTTGHDNVVGNGNQAVQGDGNNVAFGSGSALSGVKADHGSAVSGNGNASGNDSVNDSYNKVHTETHESTSIDDSYNTDSSSHVHTDVDDHSTNHTDVGSHNATDLHVG